MSQTKFNFPSIFNPASQTEDEILSNFIIRLTEFNELFSTIKKDKMENPPQHFMIQGQRGYGKTTLLLRLRIEIKNDKDLNSWLVPVMFDEEQYSVRTLAKLWEEVIEVLENEDNTFEGLSDKIDALYDSNTPEEEIYNLLISSLKERNKKIVLLLDNFGDMIQKFTRKENQRLREVLITCNHIRLIGASSAILEFYYDYKQPFFDFFKVIMLDELNREETILLLRKLGETYKSEEINQIIEKQPERIEALRRLTGGVPRTIVLLFQIFADDINGDSIKDLEIVLDKVTPIYKHRLDSLSTQQQAIIDAIAQNWDAISTKEISKKIRMASKSVSSQLNQLEKNQLIVKIPTSTKNQLYQISERFFNIYYLMRLGKRKNKRKVLWLVKFFEIMCGEKELIARAQMHIKGIREGAVYDKHAFYISQALAKTQIPPDLQYELLSETKKYLSAVNSELINEIDKSHFEILDEVKNDILNRRYDSAKKKLKDDGMIDEVIPFTIAEILRTEKGDYKTAVNFYEKAIEKGHSGAMFNLAWMYQTEFKGFKNAEKYYLMAIEKGHSYAMYNLALMYETEFKDFKNAEKYYLMAIEKGDYDAMNNLALMYMNEFKDLKNAEKYYFMAIGKGDYKAMYNLALLYQTEFKDFKNAEKYYLMAVEKSHVHAMNNLAVLYQNEFKDFKNAEKYYLMDVEKGHSGAMYNLALMYETEFKDFKNAEKYYLMAVEKDHSDAMYNLAFMYQTEFKDLKNAEKYYLMAIEKGDSEAMNNLAWMYFEVKKNKKEALDIQTRVLEKTKENYVAHTYAIILLWNDKIEEAIKVYDEFFNNYEAQEVVNESVYFILLMFLAKKQYNFVLRLFIENKFDIKDKYKPIYYAVIKLLGEEFADEFRKIPPELKETVDEIIKQVEQMSKDYS